MDPVRTPHRRWKGSRPIGLACALAGLVQIAALALFAYEFTWWEDEFARLDAHWTTEIRHAELGQQFWVRQELEQLEARLAALRRVSERTSEQTREVNSLTAIVRALRADERPASHPRHDVLERKRGQASSELAAVRSARSVSARWTAGWTGLATALVAAAAICGGALLLIWRARGDARVALALLVCGALGSAVATVACWLLVRPPAGLASPPTHGALALGVAVAATVLSVAVALWAMLALPRCLADADP